MNARITKYLLSNILLFHRPPGSVSVLPSCIVEVVLDVRVELGLWELPRSRDNLWYGELNFDRAFVDDCSCRLTGFVDVEPIRDIELIGIWPPVSYLIQVKRSGGFFGYCSDFNWTALFRNDVFFQGVSTRRVRHVSRSNVFRGAVNGIGEIRYFRWQRRRGG